MNVVVEEPKQRPRNAERTRNAILTAAQRLFAIRGYTTTGVREIATEAGVNSALVRRYFGSKEGLLQAVLEDLLRIEPVVSGDRATFGVRAAEMLLHADSIANPVAIMMLAMADLDARKLCAKLVQDYVLQPLAEWLGGDDALSRAAQLNTLWTGFIVQRHLTPPRQLDDVHVRPAQQWVARVTQSIADESSASRPTINRTARRE